MHSRRGQGRGYGSPRAHDSSSEEQQQQHQHHQQHGGGGGRWQHHQHHHHHHHHHQQHHSHQEGERMDRTERAEPWRPPARASRGAESRPGSQDWRSDAGILSRSASEYSSGHDYGGRRGEDQGGGGGRGHYSARRSGTEQPQGPEYGYGYGYVFKRGLEHRSPGYGSRRAEDSPQSFGYREQGYEHSRGRRHAPTQPSRSSFHEQSSSGYLEQGAPASRSESFVGHDPIGTSSRVSGFVGTSSSTGPAHHQGPWGAPPIPLKQLLPQDSGLSVQGEVSSIPASATDTSMSLDVAMPEPSSQGTLIEGASSSALTTLKLVAPPRPLAGNIGEAIKVRANHFKVTFHPGDNIYQYDVEIIPKISSKGIARILERQLTELYRSEFNGKLPVYDGSKSMYTHGPLPFDYREFVVKLAEDRGSTGREKMFTIAIRHVSTLNRKNLEDFLKGRQVPTPQEHLQALDVLLREHPALHFISVSRSFFKSELGSSPLEGGLVALNGFYQSLRPTENGLQLNIDLSTTAFHASIPVIDFLKQQFRNFDPRNRLSDAVRLKIKRALARLKVQVIHRQTPRRYRISGLSTSPTKDLKFPIEGGLEMRVIDYFKQTYNCILEYPELPCLQVQANKPSYLPMEVCVICDGQKYGGKLNDRQTKSLRDLACVLPRVREGKIRSIMNKDDGPGRGEHVRNFGVQVVSELTVVNARLLPPPKLRYGDQGKVKEITPNLGSWNLLNSCVVEGGNVAYWALIIFDQFFNERMAGDFVSSLSKRCNELGVRMSERTVIPPLLCRSEDLESPKLEKYLRRVYEQASIAIREMSHGQTSQLQLLVCVMADKHPAYGELKRICETQIGIVTQCCLSKHVKQKRSQYLANLALKVNAKVGGRNVTLALELPRMCPVFNRPTIIFGADVTHPSPGDDTGPSIAAVVANIDWPSANRYIARVRAQAHREEIIENLKEMVQELWREFCEKTGSRPDRVIMFRDGVSEGQFDEVLQREVVALKEAFLEEGGPGYKPLITWAVVQKRHHTRLFPADQYKDKNNNILPGTVVDSTITHPREFDFFLCSHAGIQGTSRPTHYHVLWDENNFKSDDLQGLVYNLCYTYARCTRAVSVVPPAYYAHLAAYRARLYLDSLGGSDTTSHKGGSDSASFRGMRSGTASSGGGGGGSSRAGAPVVRPLPRVQRNVQEVMYFC